ncbi:GNAT family N-acetyltransferase [Roseofilum casamattae]|uniref:N-acetyltransferase n=1 Tax=Roseofilum casamattae BLCC-M143 TaxID=3022442 RepID=A0ABT7BVN3_9CYAN|nr:N-acetyltransferase [Roseofilum casamattae]MDJ1183249.1 N-acetyltransferase [Roseofilum casamattae BLCC-M143]
MYIREALESDLDDVLAIERSAFGQDEEAELVRDLLEDPSAQPVLSLLAFQEEEPAGHVLFTKARLTTDPDLSIVLLAPLAVVPKFQKQGIGGKLIETGAELLASAGVTLIFLAGYPAYYTRNGFQPASPLGFEPTYPMPESYPDAWMVRELRPGTIASVSGKVLCAKAIDDPKYWRE